MESHYKRLIGKVTEFVDEHKKLGEQCDQLDTLVAKMTNSALEAKASVSELLKISILVTNRV